MTAFNSIQSHFNSIYQQSQNLTFSQHLTLIKTEIEHSPINVLELGRQLNNLTLYLEKASPEEMRRAFKVLNQVKDKVQISGNDWEKSFNDIERKFIQADLINWENIPEAKGEVSEASKRILHIFDYQSKALSSCLTNFTNFKLNSLPESFGQLSQLQYLKLSYNRFESLPETFGQLSQLQSLQLFSSLLEFLPESFGELSQLQELYLSNNQIQSLPESFSQLSRLQKLYLSDNQLRSLPELFGQFSPLPRA